MRKPEPPPVNYLRLSITDRCNLRCSYCTYWQEWQRLPPAEILSYEELLRLAAAAWAAGIRKIRVTGGEPLVRRGVVEFIRRLRRVPGLEVCLTTNGVLLPELAPALHDAGLRHLNVSLDTLRPDRYRQITGSDSLPRVRAGLKRAAALGFNPLKINCVVLKGINDDELLPLASLARDYPYQVRFIELMPTLSPSWWQRHYLPMAEVRRRLAILGAMEEAATPATAGPARTYRLPGFSGELGFIAPVSQPECGACNRLRLSASGQLRPCLNQEATFDLKTPLRQGLSHKALSDLFQEAIRLKAWGHCPWPTASFPCRAMASIGG